MFGTHTEGTFNAALHRFYIGCQSIHKAHMQSNHPTLALGEWRLDWLKKRVRIVRDSSAHCFVDMATGDVLKAASWAAPAKHARGNIYDADNGLSGMGPYGPAQMKPFIRVRSSTASDGGHNG
jgi:hypothetical protein